ncbi:hypothetical protein SEA_DEJAVU_9 [Microbacterium Phage DejaVu]|nr:hypothetical protein SEA_DEJAVU_9 [Microbacterium Phage DejaVu]
MTRTITPEEIKHGDRIRLTREFTVGKATDASSAEILDPLDGDGEVWDRESQDYVYVQDQGFTIELIKRELPPLPTKSGSVVKVSSKSGSATWILTVGGQWYSSERNSKTPEQFLAFLERNDFTLEVIA